MQGDWAYTALKMSKFLSAYFATLVVMVTLDLIWLGVVAKPIYQAGIGHLMADKPDVAIAIVFYAVFALGLMVFAVAPWAAQGGWLKMAAMAGLFGFFAYATYDLTNLATLKQWPLSLALTDMAWGTVVSAVSACAGKWIWLQFDSA